LKAPEPKAKLQTKTQQFQSVPRTSQLVYGLLLAEINLPNKSINLRSMATHHLFGTFPLPFPSGPFHFFFGFSFV
jgi:hypothetical protein